MVCWINGALPSTADKADRDSLILGILYLTFQAFPIIFEEKHGFNLQSTGLTFLGIATGMLLGLCTMPYWNRCDHVFLSPGTPLTPKRTNTGALLKGSIASTKRSMVENRRRSSVS
jgi:hypothetical protein